MRIKYLDGSIEEGFILRLEGGILRAAIVGRDDITEFRLRNNTWTSDTGAAVSFEFLSALQDQLADVLTVRDILGPEAQETLHCVAGNECLLRRLANTGTGYPLA